MALLNDRELIDLIRSVGYLNANGECFAEKETFQKLIDEGKELSAKYEVDYEINYATFKAKTIESFKKYIDPKSYIVLFFLAMLTYKGADYSSLMTCGNLLLHGSSND